MRLRYAMPTAGSGVPNFGDQLNPFIFNHLLPGYFDDHYTEVDFLGIGTTLGMLIPPDGPSRKTIVFSSGLGGHSKRAYGKPPELNDHFDFMCVRGPLTADALGIPHEKAITDGALLLLAMPQELPDPISSGVVFVPHMSTVSTGGAWVWSCERAGVTYLDPCTTDVNSVIAILRGADLVLAEAMHAAIVADAFGVPWIPVVTNSTINSFKWEDWCSSIGVEFAPRTLPRLLSSAASAHAIAAKLERRPDSGVVRAANAGYAVADRVARRAAVRGLTALSRSGGVTSAEPLRRTKLAQLEECLQRVVLRYPL